MKTARLITRKDRETPLGFPVILYVNINNTRMSFYTDVYIRNHQWLSDNKVSRKDDLWAEKNSRLQQILSDVTRLILTEDDAKIIKQEIPILLSHEQRKDKRLVDYMEEFMRTKAHTRTAKLYQVTINKIKAYDGSIRIEDVDKKWLLGFEEFCSRNMRVNGYGVYLRNIRAVFNYLISEDRISNYPFRSFHIKTESTFHKALSADDMRLLIRYDCQDYIRKYRDIFLLSFLLIGINMKDLLNLKEENIIDGRIVYHRFKTNRLYGIKVEKEAMDIINMYRGKRHLLCFLDKGKDHLAFIRAMNKGLKRLGPYIKVEDKRGIKQKLRLEPLFPNLTSNWARHTWASIAFEIGIPKDVISLSLGHSSGVRVTDIYIKYDQKKIDEANRKVINFILEEKPPFLREEQGD